MADRGDLTARAVSDHSVEVKVTAPVVAELSWGQVHAFRLAGHHLVERAPKEDLLEVTGDIGGAQAQVMSAAELQIASRSECGVSDVRDALWRDRSLVKTWLMRGTLHLIPARDLPIFTTAIAGRSMSFRPSWVKYFGTTQAELARLTLSIGSLVNGRPMTREEIVAAVGKGQPERIREYLKSGWGGFLKPAARMGLLCFGPSRGQSVTFVNPRQWLGSWREVDPDVALAEVARRYLHAYGPATRQDFALWFGHWPGVGPAAWEALKDELATVSVEGRIAQMLAADLKRVPSAARGQVRLLASFDPYLMGWASRAHLFDASHRAKVSRTAGWISAVLLVDGRVEGTWTHAISKHTLQVRLVPFEPLRSRVVTQARRRAAELARSLGVARAEMTIA